MPVTRSVPATAESHRPDGVTERQLDALLCRLSRDAEARPVALSHLQSALIQLGPGRGEDLVDALQDALGARLSPVQVGRLRLAHDVFWAFSGQPVFDPALAGLLRRHSSGFLLAALAQPGWLVTADHPLHQLADLLARVAQGWSSHHVRAAVTADAMADWLQALTTGDPPRAVLRRATGWVTREQRRAGVLAERLREAELGGLKLSHVRQRVAGTVSRLVAGRQLPDFMVRQVVDHWLPGLQWLLLQQGEQGAEWPQATRLFGLMVWTLQPGLAGGASADKWLRVCADVRATLAQVVPSLLREPAACTEVEEQVAAAHLALQQGRELHYVDLPRLAGASVLDSVDAQLSHDLLDEITALSSDTWFMDGQGRRMHMLVRDNTYQQLVFVNQAGVRELGTGFESFALQLSSGEIRVVPGYESLASMLALQLDGLQQRADKENSRRQREAQRQSSRDKALAEAQELEQALDAAAQQAAEDNEMTLRRHGLRIAVAAMPLGTWITLAGADKEKRLKLSVILPSSGRYVFVDRQGNNPHTFDRCALVDQVMAGDIVIDRQDKHLDDAIDRLVEGMGQ